VKWKKYYKMLVVYCNTIRLLSLFRQSSTLVSYSNSWWIVLYAMIILSWKMLTLFERVIVPCTWIGKDSVVDHLFLFSDILGGTCHDFSLGVFHHIDIIINMTTGNYVSIGHQLKKVGKLNSRCQENNKLVVGYQRCNYPMKRTLIL